MSADNGIYILKTLDHFKKEGYSQVNVIDEGGRVAYRVAHAQAIDNVDYYCKEENRHNLGWYLDAIWGKSPVFYDENEAWDYARQMSKNFTYLEYGLDEIDLSEINFPGY